MLMNNWLHSNSSSPTASSAPTSLVAPPPHVLLHTSPVIIETVQGHRQVILGNEPL